MARKRVIAHFMHETEESQVVPRLTDSTVTPGFAMGEIDEAEMAQLERQGIVFQELDAPPQPPLRTRDSQVRMTAATPGAVWEPQLGATSAPSNTYFLTLVGPLLPRWRTDLESLGVSFREALSEFRWVARINRLAIFVGR